MSEWLTTGQMIDRLKVGEIAEGDVMKIRVTKTKVGSIADVDTGERLQLAFSVDNIKWRILPKYVSFEEAKVAYENGKIIGLHNDNSERVTYFKKVNNEHLYSFNKENWSFSFVSLTWREILEGKWTIEE
jgi:hypothetical protein